MKKSKYLLCVILAALCALFAFAACKVGDEIETEKKEYSVTLVYNDGVTPNAVTKLKEGSGYTLPSSEPRTGYSFGGWKTGETLYTAGDAYTVNADVTFTAQWTLALYTVSYDLAGGKGNFSQPDAAMGASVALPATEPTRDGYEFVGWVVTYPDANETAHTVEVSNDSFEMPAANVTITAQWTKFYTVTFDLAGGEGSFSQPDTKAGERVTIQKPDPTRNGYEFDGWIVSYFDSDEILRTFALSDNAFSMPAGDVTVTAQWLQLYTVSYDLAGGTGEYPQLQKTENSKVSLPVEEPLRKGYEFDRWVVSYGENQTVPISYHSFKMPAADVTVTAQWLQLYTVSYDLAGGTGAYPQLQKTENSKVNLPVEEPSREDYEFGGWVVSYGENQTVPIFYHSFTMPAADVTVTAQWRDIVYTVIYSGYEFSQTVEYIAGQKVSEGKNYVVPQDRNGVAFGYWYYLEQGEDGDSYLKFTEETVVADFLKARGERTITLEAEYAYVIGKEDFSASVPEEGYAPEKTVCDIGKGQLVKISGRMKSRAEENWQTVLTYLYSGDAPKGFFRLDWWIEDGSTGENPGWEPQNITAAEGWKIALDGRFNWPDSAKNDYSHYRETIANCDFSVSFDWTYEKEIRITLVASNDIYRQTMYYLISPAGDEFTNNTYHIGFRADNSYAEFYHLSVHAQHDFVNHICKSCGAVDKASLDAIQMNPVEGYDTYDPQPETDSAGNLVWYNHPSPAITVTGDFAVKFTYEQGTLEHPTTVIEIFKDNMYFDANPNDGGWWYSGVDPASQGSVKTWKHGSPSLVAANAEMNVTVYVWRVGFVLCAHYEAQDANGGLVYSFTVHEDFSAISRSETVQVRLNGLCAGGANWQAFTKPAEQ